MTLILEDLKRSSLIEAMRLELRARLRTLSDAEKMEALACAVQIPIFSSGA